jgi:hypothetical protein
MKQVILLLSFIFSLHTYSQESRIKITGKVRSDSLVVEGAHVINLTSKVGTVSDALGKFKIPVKLNDTILFSDIEFKNIQVIVNEVNIYEKYLEIDFQVNINELDEIIIANNMAGLLGLPNSDKDPLSQAERKTNYYKKGGAITKLQGLLSGEAKKRRLLQRLSEEDEKTRAYQIQILKIREYFKDELFINSLKIPEEDINNFISHCLQKGVIQMYKGERYLEIIDVFIASTESFKKLKNPALAPE